MVLNRDKKAEEYLQEKIIFMTLQEFYSIFGQIHVCHYNEQFIYNQITMRHFPKAYSIAKFSCPVASECIFELVQIDHRFYRGDPNYQYSPSRFMIFKLVDDCPQYIGGSFSTKKYNHTQMNLTEGEYFVISMMDWKEEVYDVSFSAYSEADIKFERIHYNDNPNIIASLFKSFLEDGTKKYLSKDKALTLQQKAINELQINIELIMNTSGSNAFTLKRDIIALENASLLTAHISESNNFELQIAPRSSKAIIVGVHNGLRPVTFNYNDK